MRLILTVCLGYLFATSSTWAFFDGGETFEDSVIIRSQVANGNTGVCSGALIAPDLVVTAAHCLQNNTRHRVNRIAQVQDWVPSGAIYVHPKYDPTRSYSAFDIGFIQLQFPLRNPPPIKPVCREDHWGERLFRVGFGGREGYNRKMIFELKEMNYLFSTQTLVIPDPYSASGDSGGPIYATENGALCLLGVHSTIDLGEGPQLSYNPSIRAALTTLQSMMRQ